MVSASSTRPALLALSVAVGVIAPAAAQAQSRTPAPGASRLAVPVSRPFIVDGVGPFVLAGARPPAFPAEDDELYLSLKAHPSMQWIWLGDVAHGQAICAGECTLRLAPGIYHFGITRAGEDVVAMPPMSIRSSGLLEGRFYRARRADVTGAIFTALGGGGVLGSSIALASGLLDYRNQRIITGGFLIAAVVIGIYGIWRLLRGPIRERHHYTPWVRSVARRPSIH